MLLQGYVRFWRHLDDLLGIARAFFAVGSDACCFVFL